MLRILRNACDDMGKAARASSVAVAIIAGALLLLFGTFLLGARLGWWGMATTEIGPLPADAGGVTVQGPAREDFSSERAWDDYESHWRDPYWDGEHPEGLRYKVASFVKEERAGYWRNAFVAGCVQWRFAGDVDGEEASSLAELVGADEFYLLDVEEVRFASGQRRAYRRLMLYFDEGIDIWAKREEVEKFAEASVHDFHGAADLVPLDSAWLPNP